MLNTTITIKDSSHQPIEVSCRLLECTDLPQMLDLQTLIYNQLIDKTWYACSTKEEFEDILSTRGCGVGYFTPNQELIAFGVYLRPQLDHDNYGYDIDLSESDLLQVGQIESTLVHPNFRGNRLQDKVCNALESIGETSSTPLMMATVCPDNSYSLNTFIKRGYSIKKEKLKYGGLKRYILLKVLG